MQQDGDFHALLVYYKNITKAIDQNTRGSGRATGGLDETNPPYFFKNVVCVMVGRGKVCLSQKYY